MRKVLGGRLVLAAGLAVFLSAKIFFILAQTAAMGMPRLGDDAFTHLWRATQIERVGLIGALQGNGDVAYRGSADIATLCQTDTQASSTSHALCARVADNTAGADVKAGASLLLHAALQTGLPWKWVYALFEAIVATILGLSIAYFLVRLVGSSAAGLGLTFLAFMTLLPPQGLHQFVASTLAIALSLALWGLVVRRESPYLYAASTAGAGVLGLVVHPVALVYGSGLLLLAIYAFRRKLTPARLAIIAAAAVAALLVLLSFPNPAQRVLAEAASADLWSVASVNLMAVPQRLIGFATRNGGIVAALGIALFLGRRLIDGWLLAVGGTLLLLLTVSLFYNMNFFTFSIPLDLFARIFNGMAVLGCGFIGAVLVMLWRDGSRVRRTAIAAATPLLLLPSLSSWQASFYDNINGRREVVDERFLKHALASLSPDATLAYGELEISPTAVFLAGGGDRGAIPMMGLGLETLARTLDERRPAAMVLPNYHILNNLAAARSDSLARRRYGFPAAVVSTVAIGAPGVPIVTLYVRIENDDDRPAMIGPIRCVTDSGQQRILGSLTAPAHSITWMPLEIGQSSPAQIVGLDLPPSGTWITGFAVNDPPRDGVSWPWDAQAVVRWQRRDLPQGRITQAVFSPYQLFKYWNRQGPDSISLPNLQSVISDESGLVFIATDYATEPSQE